MNTSSRLETAIEALRDGHCDDWLMLKASLRTLARIREGSDLNAVHSTWLHGTHGLDASQQPPDRATLEEIWKQVQSVPVNLQNVSVLARLMGSANEPDELRRVARVAQSIFESSKAVEAARSFIDMATELQILDVELSLELSRIGERFASELTELQDELDEVRRS